MNSVSNNEAISVIIPFYEGNVYVKKIISNIVDVCRISNVNITDIIFVNDSPWEEIKLPELDDDFPITITTLKNEQNCGIQESRVKGLSECKTTLLIFLDQDDELIADGFAKQVKMINDADIVVGNGFYQYGEEFKPIYKNKVVMEYLIQKKRFIEIRNLIPSPGCCLFRRDSIPQKWKNSCLKKNGADDWYLWLLAFSEGKIFAVNERNVYQHNSTEVGNLSADLEKMYQSSLEMYEKLKEDRILDTDELDTLRRAIEFKYLQDTKQLSLYGLITYRIELKNNILYKFKSLIYSNMGNRNEDSY